MDVQKKEAPEELVEEVAGISPDQLNLNASIDVNQENESESVTDSTDDSTDQIPNPEGGLRICPCCGWDTARSVPEVSDDELHDYITALLGNKRYKKVYTFLDDKLKFVFEERTDYETRIMDKMMHDWMVGEQVIHVTMITNQFRRLQTATTLRKIETPEFEFVASPIPYEAESYKEFFAAIDKMFEGLSDSLYAQAYKLSWEFNGMIAVLSQKVVSENL